MDENKRIKLNEVGYQILKVCSRCKHADIKHNSDWGTCKNHMYKHKKHTVSERQLSINRYGTCTTFGKKDGKTEV